MARHSSDRPTPHHFTGTPPPPRPTGRPTPKPVDIDLAPPVRRVKRTPLPKRTRTRRRLGRWLRTAQGRWLLIGLACVVVLLVGLLAEGFLSSAAPSVAPPTGSAGSPLAGGSVPPPSGSARSSTPAGAHKSGALVGDQQVLQELKSQIPDNPLNHLHGAAVHQVLIEAISSETIPVVGWLVPTGLGNTYGTQRNVASPWTLRQQALGKGYLAAVFVQAGRDGAPVTCKVIVDGKVTNTETTSGAYGRTVCLG